MKKIGLFGGTFDPIHFGHINLALELMEKKGLDEVWLIPANLSPHKLETPPLDVHHRLKMCQLATDDLNHFKVIDSECRRKPPSYTVDTLTELKAKYPLNRFYLLLGNESVPGFYFWKDPLKILQMAELLIGTRSGFTLPPLEGDPIITQAITAGWTPIRQLEISATSIRNRIKENLYISHLVPHKVVDYIHKNQLY